jgi:hypothetical protein
MGQAQKLQKSYYLKKNLTPKNKGEGDYSSIEERHQAHPGIECTCTSLAYYP